MVKLHVMMLQVIAKKMDGCLAVDLVVSKFNNSGLLCAFYSLFDKSQRQQLERQ